MASKRIKPHLCHRPIRLPHGYGFIACNMPTGHKGQCSHDKEAKPDTRS